MKEPQRIQKLLRDLYDGSPWIEVTLMEKLHGLSAEQAGKKLFPDWNSIWQIVNHLAKWRMEVLSRVNGEVTTSPDDNFFGPLEDPSEEAWQQALAELRESQKEWMGFLETFPEQDLEKVYPGNRMTYYEHILGIVQHDAYHLGQIALLAKAGSRPVA
ncbi:MAG TPA: DinB family protein [Sphingobacteriaceae bacterium]